MGKGINYYTFRERLKLGRTLRSVSAKYGSVNASRAALKEAAATLEAAVEAKPSEWVFWYALGDLYQPLGEFAESVRAAEKCVDLRPDDPRSLYALATNLRTLTHAKYIGHHVIEARRRLENKMGISGYAFPFAPDRSQAALEELGLTLDQATERTIGLFEDVLALRVPSEDSDTIRESIAALCQEFPHLAQSPKARTGEPVSAVTGAATHGEVCREDMSDEVWAKTFKGLFEMLTSIGEAMEQARADPGRDQAVQNRAAAFLVAHRSVPKPEDSVLGLCYDHLGKFAFDFIKWSGLVDQVAAFAKVHGYKPTRAGELSTGYRYLFSDSIEEELTRLASQWDNDSAAALRFFSLWLEGMDSERHQSET